MADFAANVADAVASSSRVDQNGGLASDVTGELYGTLSV